MPPLYVVPSGVLPCDEASYVDGAPLSCAWGRRMILTDRCLQAVTGRVVVNESYRPLPLTGEFNVDTVYRSTLTPVYYWRATPGKRLLKYWLRGIILPVGDTIRVRPRTNLAESLSQDAWNQTLTGDVLGNKTYGPYTVPIRGGHDEYFQLTFEPTSTGDLDDVAYTDEGVVTTVSSDRMSIRDDTAPFAGWDAYRRVIRLTYSVMGSARAVCTQYHQIRAITDANKVVRLTDPMTRIGEYVSDEKSLGWQSGVLSYGQIYCLTAVEAELTTAAEIARI